MIFIVNGLIFASFYKLRSGEIYYGSEGEQIFTKRVQNECTDLTVTRHSSSFRHKLFRLSDPSPHSRLSRLSISSCVHNYITAQISIQKKRPDHVLAGQMTDLHSELSFVEAHQHVYDVKACGGFVLLVNSSEQRTKSLQRQTGDWCAFRVFVMFIQIFRSKATVTISECQPVIEYRVCLQTQKLTSQLQFYVSN